MVASIITYRLGLNLVISLAFTLDQSQIGWNRIKIFDGLESHSPNITDKLCRSLPPPIESHGSQMMILFETDYQSGEKGFSATYTTNENSACGGLVSIPATASADIKSPDYPSEYPPSTECKWLVDSHQTYNTTFKVGNIRCSATCFNSSSLLHSNM